MAEKKNPFAQKPAATSSEETKVAATKTAAPAVAKKPVARKAPVAKKVEPTEAEGTTLAEGDIDVLTSTAAEIEEIAKLEAPKVEKAEAAEPNKKATRRTAATVEAEAAERESKLQAQIDELRAKVSGVEGAQVEFGLVRDVEVGEGESGGTIRQVGDGRTLVNNDWRVTKDGLRLLVGRNSSQAYATFQVPIVLGGSLAELLAHLDTIAEV